MDGWLALDILAVAMIPALLSGFFSGCVLVIFNHEKKLLISTSIAAVVNILLNLFMLPIYGIEGAAATTFIAELVNVVIQFRYAKKHLSGRLVVAENLFKCLLGSITIIVICFITRRLFGDGIKALLISVPLSCISYAGFNLLTHNSLFYSFLKLDRRNHRNAKEKEE